MIPDWFYNMPPATWLSVPAALALMTIAVICTWQTRVQLGGRRRSRLVHSPEFIILFVVGLTTLGTSVYAIVENDSINTALAHTSIGSANVVIPNMPVWVIVVGAVDLFVLLAMAVRYFVVRAMPGFAVTLIASSAMFTFTSYAVTLRYFTDGWAFTMGVGWFLTAYIVIVTIFLGGVQLGRRIYARRSNRTASRTRA